ncbi:Maf family protein [Alkanindiges illinoisensis]|uniref:Nucleoside triphosphate pyrophosphatase n=1 Tax=Alkanindiges illinoisensis TaxID=197183 RepID=A0A4Y7XGD4_9GAMM|nr:Maf family protein [Alkanindiges illinoisensis]TEU30329.1 septum formation protein Maf [Alkanindiges illinoisensis]
MRSDQFRPPIILASTSSIRRQLLSRLNVPFDVISPEIDESPFERENAQTLSCRLAEQKAATISAQFPHALVIGSDQVVWIESEPHVFIGKPLTAARAYEQLRNLSGKLVHFETAVNVQCQQLNINRTELIRFLVHFRNLSAVEIQRYVAFDQPFYSAGSIKAESLGISLFEAMHGEDFTALMGLPLIKLSQMLREVGWQVP